MKKVVILKRSLIDSLEEFVLTECLGIMFPECHIDIRSIPCVNSPDKFGEIQSNNNKYKGFL
jgi:hypothetical protein